MFVLSSIIIICVSYESVEWSIFYKSKTMMCLNFFQRGEVKEVKRYWFYLHNAVNRMVNSVLQVTSVTSKYADPLTFRKQTKTSIENKYQDILEP